MLLHFVVGFVVGFFTANPVIGLAVGAVLGAGIGSGTAGYIISGHYDINFNRVRICAYLIGGSAIAGLLGGVVGGLVPSPIQTLEKVPLPDGGYHYIYK